MDRARKLLALHVGLYLTWRAGLRDVLSPGPRVVQAIVADPPRTVVQIRGLGCYHYKSEQQIEGWTP